MDNNQSSERLQLLIAVLIVASFGLYSSLPSGSDLLGLISKLPKGITCAPSQTQVASGQAVTFNFTTSMTPAATSASIKWSVPYGVPSAGTGTKLTTIFKNTGKKAVTRTVTVRQGKLSGKCSVVVNGKVVATATKTTPVPNISCASPTDTTHMDIFDSHVHASSKISLSQIISEMNKAGVSVANVYSGTLENASQYPGRFITFVDTPDQPQPSTWLTQGQAFVTSAEEKLKTGKYYGIGEANLRYYGSAAIPVPPPNIDVSPDAPTWLQLVDLAAKYHVPISFHFVPDDATANAAFERMLNHNKDATLIWAHLGFNNMPLNSATLNDFLLRYPHLYFDTAGIQGMHNPTDGSQGAQNSAVNWERMMPNGQLSAEWKKFFETWNSRILVATDAGGGQNSLERWLNYSGNISNGAPDDSIGHWRSLTSNLDMNSARNILNANSRELFLKEQKPAYNYSVSSNGTCQSISVRSESSVSALMFNPSTRTITFTVANSSDTPGDAVVTIPTALMGGNIAASVDGQNVKSQTTSNSTSTTVSLEYAGGIRTITLNASDTLY